jgi:hypothetical protein
MWWDAWKLALPPPRNPRVGERTVRRIHMAAKKKSAQRLRMGQTSARGTMRSPEVTSPASAGGPRLLSGDNPQIAKGEGDAPVREYLAALPGWKGDIGRRLDALIERAVPKVHRAVKWNSPMYSAAGSERFLSLHAYTNFMRVAFFRGALLRPLPPGASKQGDTRYFDVRQDDDLDEAQFIAWVKQARKLPGLKL